MKELSRLDIVLVALDPTRGSEIKKTHPTKFNQHSTNSHHR